MSVNLTSECNEVFEMLHKWMKSITLQTCGEVAATAAALTPPSLVRSVPHLLHMSLDWTSGSPRLVGRGRHHINSEWWRWAGGRAEKKCAQATWLHQRGDCSVSLASWRRGLWELSRSLAHTAGRFTRVLQLHESLRGSISALKTSLTMHQGLIPSKRCSWVTPHPGAHSNSRGSNKVPTTTWRRRDGQLTAEVGFLCIHLLLMLWMRAP